MQCVKPYNEKWLRSFIERWDKAPRGKMFQLIKIESILTDSVSIHKLLMRSKNRGRYYVVTLTELNYNFDLSSFHRINDTKIDMTEFDLFPTANTYRVENYLHNT